MVGDGTVARRGRGLDVGDGPVSRRPLALLLGSVAFWCVLYFLGQHSGHIFSDDTVPVRDGELWEMNP